MGIREKRSGSLKTGHIFHLGGPGSRGEYRDEKNGYFHMGMSDYSEHQTEFEGSAFRLHARRDRGNGHPSRRTRRKPVRQRRAPFDRGQGGTHRGWPGMRPDQAFGIARPRTSGAGDDLVDVAVLEHFRRE